MASAIPSVKRTTWKIDPAHTHVEFSVRHMMFSTVKGRFTGVRGAILIDEEDPTRSFVEAEIDAASINTDDERRDAHLRSAEFLEVETYPTITFKSTRVDPQESNRALVVGNLTIRGITHETALDTEFTGRGTTPFGTHVIGFEATTTIHRKDFGLTWNVSLESGGVLVGDAVKVEIHVEAVQEE